MRPLAITGARLTGPEGLLDDHALLVEEGRIAAILPVRDIPTGFAREILDGGLVVPGFIDVQVNGGGGVLFNESPSREGMAAIAAAHRKFGSTGIMPTLISDDPAVVESAVAAADEAVAAGDPGILGVHIEGPFLNPAKRGIHDSRKLRPLDEAAMDLLTRPGPARKMLTIAPELAPPGAVRRLTQAGVLVCAGHSLADYAQTKA